MATSSARRRQRSVRVTVAVSLLAVAGGETDPAAATPPSSGSRVLVVWTGVLAAFVLAADQLMASPRLYGTFLLWLLSELFEELPEAGDLDKPRVLWVAYPKGNTSDVNRDSLWPIVAEFGMRPNGQVAIDDRWSALRFRANREGEEPFTGGR